MLCMCGAMPFACALYPAANYPLIKGCFCVLLHAGPARVPLVQVRVALHIQRWVNGCSTVQTLYQILHLQSCACTGQQVYLGCALCERYVELSRISCAACLCKMYVQYPCLGLWCCKRAANFFYNLACANDDDER